MYDSGISNEGVSFRMRRRSRRGPNTSESTGKIGQELPPNQPAPLVPFYPDEPGAPAQQPKARSDARPQAIRPPQQPSQPSQPRQPRQEQKPRPEWNEPPGSGRLEVETQPEMPVAPPPQRGRAPRPKGFVVLAIGLPGSGKTTWFGRRGITPLSSDLLRNILFDDVEEQRYQGLVFSTLALAAARPPDRPHAHELCGRHQPLDPRAPPVDQDGQELRLRGAGRLLRCAA